MQLKVPQGPTHFKPYEILKYVTLVTINFRAELFGFVTEEYNGEKTFCSPIFFIPPRTSSECSQMSGHCPIFK